MVASLAKLTKPMKNVLSRIKLDDQLLIHDRSNLFPRRNAHDLALHGLAIEGEPVGNRTVAARFQIFTNKLAGDGVFPDLNHVANLQISGGDGFLLAVDPD